MPFDSDSAKPTASNEVNVSSTTDSNATAVQWAQDAWNIGVSEVKEHPVLTAGVVIVGGLVIHNRNMIATSGKGLVSDLLGSAEKEASSMGSNTLSQRSGAKIIDIGESSLKDGLTKLAQPNESGAFSALTQRNELVAVKLPEGGLPYVNYPKGQTLLQKGTDWIDLNGRQLNADINLVSTKTGSELHVTSPDWPLKSIHRSDGRLALENLNNGAAIEVDPLYRAHVGFRDINGTTFAGKYKAGELTSVVRSTADGQIDMLPALTSGRNTGFKLGRAHVSETTLEGQTFHSLNGKTYATVEEAMENSAKMLEINPRDIGSAQSNWATSHFNVNSNFPTEYAGRLVKTRGGVMQQTSIPKDVSTAEEQQRALRALMAN